MRNPYKFPARSRAAMITAMETIGGRFERYGESYPFAWNVKIHDIGDTTAAGLESLNPDPVPFSPQWDSAWRRHMESRDSLFWDICEAARRPYVDGEYCTFPGDDMGAYEFEFHGRSGGWLVLTYWRGRLLRNFDLDELRTPEDSGGWSFDSVRQLYRAVMTMNQDFTRDKVRAEFRLQLAYYRAQWEAGRRDAIARNRAWQTAAADNARELLQEFRAARAAGAGLVTVPAICQTIRAAIRDRIQLARRSRQAAAALANGES